MTEEQLQAIKERAYYGSRALLDFDLIQRSQADVLPLIAEVERLQKIENGMREEINRLRNDLETIANHNMFKVPQIMMRDFARKSLKTKYRTPEENAVIDKVIGNLEALEGER